MKRKARRRSKAEAKAGLHGKPEDGVVWRPKFSKRQRRAASEPDPEVVPQDLEPVEWAPEDVGELRDALEAIPNTDYHTWVDVGMALELEGQRGLEGARELWDEWSTGQDYGEYSEETQDIKWDSFRADRPAKPLTKKTIFHLAGKEGWRSKRPRKSQRATPMEDFADDLPPKLRKLLELNQNYAFVWQGQGVIADFRDPVIDLKSPKGFLAMHQFPEFPSGKTRADGSNIMSSVGELWLNRYRERRSYDEIDFYPPGAEPHQSKKRILNLWQGWPFEPGPGSCDLFLEHVKENLCSGDEELFEWVLAWMAHLVQHPEEKVGTAIILRGLEGVGKGFFGTTMVELCGDHGVHLTQPDHLTRKFNRHLIGKLVILADEVTWGGRRLDDGVLKGLVTEKTQMLEIKGVDSVPTRSYCRLIALSNNDWVVPAGSSARRWLVLDVRPDHMNDREYFGAIKAQLEDGGYEALMRLLLSVDLKKLPDPRLIIPTEALRDQKLESLDSIDQWFLTVLQEGRLSEYSKGWPQGFTPTSLFHESYLRVASDVGTPRRTIEMLVMRRLKRILGEKAVEHSQRRFDEIRKSALKIPSLEECRESFDSYIGHELDWGGNLEPEDVRKRRASVLD